MDSKPDGVAYRSSHHKLPGLNFVHGNAEERLPDESFDVVVNAKPHKLWEGALDALPLRQVSKRVLNDGVIRPLDASAQDNLDLKD